MKRVLKVLHHVYCMDDYTLSVISVIAFQLRPHNYNSLPFLVIGPIIYPGPTRSKLHNFVQNDYFVNNGRGAFSLHTLNFSQMFVTYTEVSNGIVGKAPTGDTLYCFWPQPGYSTVRIVCNEPQCN